MKSYQVAPGKPNRLNICDKTASTLKVLSEVQAYRPIGLSAISHVSLCLIIVDFTGRLALIAIFS